MDKLLTLMVVDMSKNYDVVIIGGGIFGCLCALELRKFDKKVILLEQRKELMMGATLNNQNRLHLGYHYPRDKNTALQCKKGFNRFVREYKECILDNIQNLYCISEKDSKISYSEYKKFCLDVGLLFNEINANDSFEEMNHIQCMINTNEVIYDCKILAKLINQKLLNCNVNFKLNSLINNLK